MKAEWWAEPCVCGRQFHNEAEAQLHMIVMQGCGAAMIANKANRFGATDRNVLNPTGPTNAERLVAELNDLLAVSDMLAAVGVIPKDWRSMEAQDAKKAKVRKFVEYAKTKGAITDV